MPSPITLTDAELTPVDMPEVPPAMLTEDDLRPMYRLPSGQTVPQSSMAPWSASSFNPDTGERIQSSGLAPRVSAGEAPMPDLNAIYRTAFAKLPVDEASKTVEAAIQYQGQRGYQKDIANGVEPAEALAKWGPLLFRGSSQFTQQAISDRQQATQQAIAERMKANQEAIAARQDKVQSAVTDRADARTKNQNIENQIKTITGKINTLVKSLASTRPKQRPEVQKKIDDLESEQKTLQGQLNGTVEEPAATDSTPVTKSGFRYKIAPVTE